MGFGEGIPKTYLLSVDAPVKVLHGGVGLNVMQDQVGFFTSSMVNIGYAFRKPLGPGVLGIGANFGFINNSLNGNWRAIDGHQMDASIPNDRVSDFMLDASFGLYYNIGEQLYFGISSTHLPAPTMRATDLNYDIARHYYIMAGYSTRLTDELDIKPSLFVKTDGVAAQVDLNCNVMYNKMFWAGLSYRLQDAVVALVGFQHTSGLKVGFAYDFTTSGMANAGDGGRRRVNTGEIMVGYCFKMPERVKINRHRNVRFL
jgi:type IX secretion system PorP/SprF family membrane protein